MNSVEAKMLDLLKRGRDEHGVVAVKAEFEAEGTRPDEFLRLLELARRADLKVALKIGGCEAVSDLMASRLYGVDHIVAPMVETPYALSKFIEAKDKVYGSHGRWNEFLFNLETETTLRNLDRMMLPLRAARRRRRRVWPGRFHFVAGHGARRDQRPVDHRRGDRVAIACAETGLSWSSAESYRQRRSARFAKSS